MIGRILKLAVVAVVLAAAYIVFRPEADAALNAIRERWDVLRRDTVVAQVPGGPVSERTAEAAERKIDRLRDGSNRESFASNELQSLLEYRYRPMLPAFVTSPRIALDQDKVAVHVRLPAERLPGPEDFRQVLRLLPDTTDLAIRGTLIPSDDGFVAFTVDAISAQRIPLPSRLVPAVLDMFGRQDAPGLPDNAIRIPLPEGARTAYVRADSLVVLSQGTR